VDNTLHPQLAKKLRWAPLVLITIAGAVVYLSSLSGSFIWDDVHFIKNNVYLRSPGYLPRINKKWK